MRSFFRYPQRLLRWTSVSVCLVLVVSCLAFSPQQRTSAKNGARNRPVTPQEENGKARRVSPPTPRVGPPAGNLPNLDEIRGAQPNPAQAPSPIPSTRRRHPRQQTASSTSNSLLMTAFLNSQLKRKPDSSRTSSIRSNHARAVSSVAPALPQNPSNFAMARIAPTNRTGTGGEDLLSNNFNVNLPVVGLTGRGLDLGLTLSYNSLVWIRSGNDVDFDVDDGSIAPGFRLGFATVEGPYYNDQAGTNFYLLVTPSGARIELRYTGSGNIYESKDSAHLQLINNGSSLLVRPTDGTQMNFIPVSGTWRCNQVKDRNGNFITVSYNASAEIATITDTLGRVLTFNYDGYDNLSSITQAGKAQPWVTFGWGTASIGNNFPNLTNHGPVSTSIAVLTQVGFADGARYNFEYNNTYGMVSKIRYHTSDNQLRRYTTYVTPASSTDCPRLTERRDWAENWTGVNGVPAEVVTYFAHDADGACRMTASDGTIYKEYYGSSWQSGLTTQSEVWSAGVKQKWTTIAWTQDNTGVSYLTNPRVTETNVYDAQYNRRRVTIDYGPYASYGLPNGVFEYQADGASLLRVTYTDYNLSQAYLDRRIIGLVSSVHVSDGQWQSKASYEYDTTAIDPQATTATMHDQNYHASFAARGNVSRVSRWDVTDINNANKALTVIMSYNAAGSVLAVTDPANHTNSFSYAESFSDGNNSRNTFAYPTTVTDAGGFQSSVQYDFSIGAVTRTQGPPPAGQTQGLIQTMLYDSAGRLERLTTQNNSAYTRYVYGPNYVQSFSTVNTVADEAYAIQVFDGAGRVFGTVNNHPGSAGGYRLRNTIYDQMGRAIKQANPTEINGSWLPSGDDAAGVIFSQQTYDWKGRPLVTTNQDGTQKYASYGGCGCAGGEVVTLTDEVGRQQKVYSDVLGRQWKNETLNWNGTVYATTATTFNARDQVTVARQWVGAENGGGAYQDTTMTYDGYGRLKTKHVPQQDTGSATVYDYNSDSTVQSVTDARGAMATYSYNARHLVTGITYTVPQGSAIPATPNVTFGYDAARNRTSMTDGMGSVSYSYNQLSQMTSETRIITGVGNFTLGYSYNLAGELSSITDPFSATVTYAYDSAARLSSVTGTSFGGVTTYASNPQYRAWGALKSLSYGNSKTLLMGYSNRMLPSSYEVPGILKKSYQRHNDGNVQFTQDQLTTNSKFDRSYTYDQVGRVATALTGQEARGGAATNDRPYNDTLAYDALNHLTSLERLNWDRGDGFGVHTYVNNRISGWIYDADGRLTSGSTGYFTYDAAGRARSFGDEDPYKTDQEFDGNGNRVKTTARRWDEPTEQFVTEKVTYYISSTVLGGEVVTELSEQGAKERTSVFAGGGAIASQTVSSGNQSVQWQHYDPSGASYRGTDSLGQGNGAKELDPLGANAGLIKPITWNVPDKKGLPVPHPLIADMLLYPGGGCVLDRVPIPCEQRNNLVRGGGTDAWITNPDGVTRRLYREVADLGVGLWAAQHPARSGNSSDTIDYSNPDYGLARTNNMWPAEWQLFYAPPNRGGQSQYYWLQTPQDPINRVAQLIAAKKCAEFLNGVLAELAKATGRGRDGVSFQDLFNAARNSIDFGPDFKERGLAGPDPFVIGDREFRIKILIRPHVGTDLESAPTTIQHEIVHGAPRVGPGYTHLQMADAAYIVGGRMGLLDERDFGLGGDQAKPNPGEEAAKTRLEKKTINNHNSYLFQALLIQACNKR